MNITQMREFLSHLSDDTLQRVERAADRETLASDVTPEQRDRGYSVMYAIRRVYDERDQAERFNQLESYW
jgi:hypothetical protein